jgi:flagellar capping protein FliD
MENYLTTPALGNGSFNIRDSSNTVIGTFAYDATDSLTDLANAINADPDLNATIISSGGTFRLEVTHITNDTLTFTDDTDTLISQLTITNNGNSVYSANVGGSADGADDGTITVSNNTLIFTDQSGAQGLQLLYTGNTNLGGLQIDFTQGIGSRLYFAVDDILDETTGAVANEIEGLDDQNDFTQERIDLLLERLERQRQSLLERFIAMETALTQMNAILDSIKQSFEVLTSRDN